MVLVPMECIKVQVDVVHHPDAAVAFPHVPALGPKHRLVQGVWIVPGQKNLGYKKNKPEGEQIHNTGAGHMTM